MSSSKLSSLTMAKIMTLVILISLKESYLTMRNSSRNNSRTSHRTKKWIKTTTTIMLISNGSNNKIGYNKMVSKMRDNLK